MPLNFPNSPSLNDFFVAGGRRWQWNGTAWQRIPDPGAQGVQGATGNTGPTGAQGAAGAQGATGSTGAQGNQGNTGTTGTVFTSGTRMLFHQASAPSGWTKSTTNNDRALRVVSGSTGGNQGGDYSFSSRLNSTVTTANGSVANHTLTINEMPAHDHDTDLDGYKVFATGPNPMGFIGFGGPGQYPATTFTMSNTGGGQAHNHGFTNPNFNLNVLYTDVIIAQKN